jgi:DEAD/DEAH box helicase domain-containing protein
MTLSYTDLIDELRTRTSRAHASLLAPRSLTLRHWLEQRLGDSPGGADALLGEPVFEHKFGFKPTNKTMEQLSKEGLIHHRLIDEMDAPAAEPQERFPRDRLPYTHQEESWRAVAAGQSIVVSAGTGAGKTECFVVPILSDLVTQSVAQKSTLEGVQALFLYPLNALINSQRERLSAWTRGMQGKVRYCLYNGETLSTVKQSVQSDEPERVMSRKLLRKSPPPLLITNATMLEYMLVRPEDNDILDKSKGKLKYIVIDEAHTYVGSMAAELALLLRRVLDAFDVDPADVRFIATSATLSSGVGGSALSEIQDFLADLSGQPASAVTVITDDREIPVLPTVPVSSASPDLDQMNAMSPADRFTAMVSNKACRAVRGALIAENGQTLSYLRDVAESAGAVLNDHDLVRLMDTGTRARADGAVEPFLPLRGHIFARGLAGLWACLNPGCKGRPSTEDTSDWQYGRVYTARHESCADCESPVFELTLCLQCGHDHLLASLETQEEGGEQLMPCSFDALNITTDDADDAESTDDEEDNSDDETPVVDLGEAQRLFFNLVRANSSDDVDVLTGEVGIGSHQVWWPKPDEKDHCHRCGYSGRRGSVFARPARTGRNFMLGVAVPTLLQAMPPMNGRRELPFDGRRTITFTDSRQGTARFAARSQGESERTFIRSFVYHQLLSQVPDAATVQKDQAELDQLEKQLASLPDKTMFPDIVRVIEERRKEILAKQTTPTITLAQLSNKLAATIEMQAMKRHWDLYLPFQQLQIDKRQLAEWLVLREFARRPMRRASLETLGLVAVNYAGIDFRKRPPLEWIKRTGDKAESSWADFLKLCVDFYIRSNTAISLENSDEFFRWVGTLITKKVVAGPGKTGLRNKRVTWPRAGRNSRLEGLLRRALKLTEYDAETSALINELFEQAWLCIKTFDLLRAEANQGFALKPEAFRFSLISEAWLCPVTRTLLDTTLLGHTPYAPAKKFPLSTQCKRVSMPRTPVPWGQRHSDADRAGILQWLETDPKVKAAREVGAISEFTERILEFAEYYQTAEHSAQIPSAALKQAEKAFKKGKINLLSCSTTMEMGVDIGNLSGVAMNNAPPSPANFLQRVGRAGRRGETAAVSLTVCRHLPHDQGVFHQPDWPFRTPMHITPVKLDSEPIVQRHVRAAVLTHFLKQHSPGDAAYRLTCVWFFSAPEDGEAVVARLHSWLRDPAVITQMEPRLKRLTHETVLDGIPAATLLETSSQVFQAQADTFRLLQEVLEHDLLQLPEDEREDSPAAWAINRQLFRVNQEYLLSYLADEQVLPGYGFPSGVLPFVNTTLEELKALKQDVERHKRNDDEDPEVKGIRIDARARLTGVASRDLPMAIREYAPGSTIILDRRAYTSRGVRLAWQLAVTATEAQVSGIQSLRYAWRCRQCGAAGTTQAARTVNCPSCGVALGKQVQFLLPSGFATDLFEPAKMDAVTSDFVPVQRPWISSGDGVFRGLGRPALVRWRHTSSGEIIYLSSGAQQQGYALCLRCGRAEPELEAGGTEDGPPMPSAMKDHMRLRGGKGSNWKSKSAGKPCEGNHESGWAIKRNLSLGGSIRTDVLELHLTDPTTGQYAADRVVVTTIAVALRKVAAQRLGIDARELGYEVARREQDGHRFLAILLFDTAAGGAGFVAQVPEHLPTLLQEVVTTCQDCPRDCDKVCHGCLLSNDSQYDIDDLDRTCIAPSGNAHAVLGAQFLATLQRDPAHNVYGSETAVVWRDPVEKLIELARRGVRGGPITVTLFLDGDATQWDPIAWSGRSTIRRLRALGERLTLRMAVPKGALTGLDWQVAQQLAGLIELEQIQLVEVDALPVDDGHARWAEVSSVNATRGFASTGTVPSVDTDWPAADPTELQVVGEATATPTSDPLSTDALVTPLPPATVHFDLGPAAAGPARHIGKRILAALEVASPGFLEELRAKGPADRVELHDRYLRSPMVVQVAHSLLFAVKDAGAIGAQTQLSVVTVAADSRRNPRDLSHDWSVPQAHETVLSALVESVHSASTVTVVDRQDQYRTQHHRSLEFAWGDEEWEVRFDQGFGFVKTGRSERFPFTRPEGEQITALLGPRWTLHQASRQEVPAYLIRS